MLWKLFSSDERVMEALEQVTVSYDLSPSAQLPANNDEPASTVEEPQGNKPRLWLEDWSEKDEARLQKENFWDNLDDASTGR